MVCQQFSCLALPCIVAAHLSDFRTDEWNKQHLSRMTETALKVISKATQEKVTPTIGRFALATVQKIDQDVIPDLLNEHKIAITLFDQEYSKFLHVYPVIQEKQHELATIDEVIATYTASHKACREEEHSVTTEHKSCESEKAGYWATITSYEETLKISEEHIDELWCSPHDALSGEFWETNQKIIQTYIERKESVEKAWTEYESHTCTTTNHKTTEKQSECDEKQTTLEEHSCERANFVEHWTEHFEEMWQRLTETYNVVIGDMTESELRRKEEYAGLKLVKCLLQEVTELSKLEEPCEESHMDIVMARVEACHAEQHDTSDLDIGPLPAPELPDPLFEYAPYPCGPDFLAMHYGKIGAEASVKECQNTHCSLKLQERQDEEISGQQKVQDVEETPLVKR